MEITKRQQDILDEISKDSVGLGIGTIQNIASANNNTHKEIYETYIQLAKNRAKKFALKHGLRY